MNLRTLYEQKRPLFVLAPMANVTDAAFRRVIARYGKPDVMWTEFVSADGLCSPGRSALLVDLKYTEAERPIVAQLFTGRPDVMRAAAALVQELGFDGLDINMGCPDRGVERSGSGAALIKNPKIAREIVRAAKEGAPGLPVSVKTRIGYSTNVLDTWLPELLAEEPAAVTIHARTRKEMSDVPARWEHVRESVAIRDRLGSKALILGNGDVMDLQDAAAKTRETGADGVMIGRAIMGNPWFFRSGRGPDAVSLSERLRIMLEHTRLFHELLGKNKNFAIMKKHYKAYISGWDGARDLRLKLMETKNVEEVEAIVAQEQEAHLVAG